MPRNNHIKQATAKCNVLKCPIHCVSSKVAVHSFVENLFKSIWGATQCKAPMAVRYFFDFLDTQAENMKVNDPDVLHIWKTNRWGFGRLDVEIEMKGFSNPF